jgi:hypothetical protein
MKIKQSQLQVGTPDVLSHLSSSVPPSLLRFFSLCSFLPCFFFFFSFLSSLSFFSFFSFFSFLCFRLDDDELDELSSLPLPPPILFWQKTKT